MIRGGHAIRICVGAPGSGLYVKGEHPVGPAAFLVNRIDISKGVDKPEARRACVVRHEDYLSVITDTRPSNAFMREQVVQIGIRERPLRGRIYPILRPPVDAHAVRAMSERRGE